MKKCNVCQQEKEESKFGISRKTNKNGEVKEYFDKTCMVCRRKKYLQGSGKREVHKKGSSNWYYNNPLKVKEQRLRRYGINLEQYNELRKKQDYKCGVCNKHETEVEQGRSSTTEYALQVDHCHSFGHIRGLLCTNCNTLLGKSKDSVDILQRAIDYLERNSE